MITTFPSSHIQQAAAMLLGCAIKEVFPYAMLGAYRLTHTGFSYDFLASQPISEELFYLLEEQMRSITKQDLPIRWTEMMRENAVRLFEHHQQDLQADLIADFPDKIVPIMQLGSHYDIGESLTFDSSIGFPCVKLLGLSKMEDNLWSIHGVAAEDKQNLKSLIKQLEAYKKHNAAVLAKEMQLLLDNSCLWLPKGTALRQSIIDTLVTGLVEQDYKIVHTQPQHDPADLSLLHGQMFLNALSQNYAMPVKLVEVASIFDEDLSANEPYNLLQPHSFYQDYASIFCNFNQLRSLVISSLHFMDKTIKIMGFKNQWCLNLCYRKGLGSHSNWAKSVNILEQGLKELGFDYTVDKEGNAPHGPAIEMKIVDSLGRQWSGPFLSLNFPAMERLLKNASHSEPFFMISQSCLGPIERCLGLMLEQHHGKLPLRFAPEQVRIIAVSEKKLDYAKEIQESIVKAGFRASLDIRPGKLSGKIHSAELERIPFTVLIGESEEVKNTLTIRSCDQEKNDKVKLDDFIAQLKKLMQNH